LALAVWTVSKQATALANNRHFIGDFPSVTDTHRPECELRITAFVPLRQSKSPNLCAARPNPCKTQRAIALLSTGRFVDLNVNLHYCERRYDAILAQRDERRDAMASVRGTPFRRVESLWHDYIRSQRTEVQSMLDRIAALPVTLNPPADE
jgi:hypothetical protein